VAEGQAWRLSVREWGPPRRWVMLDMIKGGGVTIDDGDIHAKR